MLNHANEDNKLEPMEQEGKKPMPLVIHRAEPFNQLRCYLRKTLLSC